MTYDETLQALVDCFDNEAGARWAAGDILVTYEPNIKALASGTGKSQSFLYNLKKTSKTFPRVEGQDDPALREGGSKQDSWSHHSYCAATSDPIGWMDRCVKEGWSTRQLRVKLTEAGEIKSQTKKQKHCPKCGWILK